MPTDSKQQATPASNDTSPVSAKPKSVKLKTKKTATAKLADEVASTRDSSPAGTVDDSIMSATASQQGDAAAEPTTQRCKHCKQQIDKAIFPGHSKQCLRDRKKKERERLEAATAAKDKDGDVNMEGDDAPPSATVETTPAGDGPTKSKSKKISVIDTKDKDTASKKTTNSKKRKADATDTPTEPKPPTKKQKKKEEAKAKAAKPKGPVDVEKQCGVLLPNGAMCARSLTCKSHAMGAKRAVPGRSMPYDMLLAAYQKKNQARQQKAALASSAPLPDDLAMDAPSGPVDSDEEKEAVMAGILRAAPRPIYSRPMMSMRTKSQHVRMKEMLAGALGGSKGSNLFSIATRADDVGGDMEASRRATPMGGMSRKSSFAPGTVA